MTRPKLGAKVRVTACVHRIWTSDRGREWQSTTCEPFEGVYMGSRFKQNGHIDPGGTQFDWEGDPISDYGPYLCIESTSEVWLIVTNPFHNPRLAFPHDCEVIE